MLLRPCNRQIRRGPGTILVVGFSGTLSDQFAFYHIAENLDFCKNKNTCHIELVRETGVPLHRVCLGEKTDDKSTGIPIGNSNESTESATKGNTLKTKSKRSGSPTKTVNSKGKGKSSTEEESNEISGQMKLDGLPQPDCSS